MLRALGAGERGHLLGSPMEKKQLQRFGIIWDFSLRAVLGLEYLFPSAREGLTVSEDGLASSES